MVGASRSAGKVAGESRIYQFLKRSEETIEKILFAIIKYHSAKLNI
ncbi:hypothetical protein [Mesobacillus foraminis]|nr:hypothetical protein [Mesobacillus foraminis]